MKSLYDELAEKLKQNQRLTKHNMARADLGLLLFNAGDALRELWAAADAEVADARAQGRSPSLRLKAAVDALRPIFGERDNVLKRQTQHEIHGVGRGGEEEIVDPHRQENQR
ncbi:MAG: hypothetical protein ACK4SA_22130 [Caldilinea sp.]